MRSLILLMLGTMFVLLQSNSALALSCRLPRDYMVAECAEEICSRAFKVDYQWLGNDCEAQVRVSIADKTELKNLLRLMPALKSEGNNPLVIFYNDAGDVNPHHALRNQHVSSRGYWIYAALNGKEEYMSVMPPAPIQLNSVKGKSYDMLKEEAEHSARLTLRKKIYSLYVVPLVFYPVLIMGAAFYVIRVRSSQKPRTVKLFFLLPAVLVPLYFLSALVINSSAHPIILWTPWVTMLVVACYMYLKNTGTAGDK